MSPFSKILWWLYIFSLHIRLNSLRRVHPICVHSFQDLVHWLGNYNRKVYCSLTQLSILILALMSLDHFLPNSSLFFCLLASHFLTSYEIIGLLWWTPARALFFPWSRPKQRKAVYIISWMMFVCYWYSDGVALHSIGN